MSTWTIGRSKMWMCPVCKREFKNTNQDHYCSQKPQDIDSYIALQNPEVQDDLILMRRTLSAALPGTIEKISWSMPTYWKGTNILHFAASKKHIGFYPGPAAVEHFEKELEGVY
ncbi:MAG: DUF1801 domain-containing protein, partial [Spirochaetales bacterium]|nr:DUF1801 domain-containing protein [Candidatus Physcosoma equi]